ncbi:MAG: polysaccharide deacetylase family protein [Acidobacteriia bacterium]|nr:polysaccharide deacetylase family protein [Terriglobia bacterium]
MFLGLSVAMHLALLALLLRNGPLTAGVLLGYGMYHVFVAWGVLHPRSRIFGPNRSRLRTRDRVAVLTFDDGPHPEVTPRVLEILRAKGIHATFFLVGKHVDRHPDVVRRIVADGHTLGCHSYGHSYLFWLLPASRLLREVRASKAAVEAASGKPCAWFRAPVGMKSCLLRRVLARSGLELVSWEVRFPQRNPLRRDGPHRRRLRRVSPGSILLLHDGHDRKVEGCPEVIDLLPRLLSDLDAMGYRCVPLS